MGVIQKLDNKILLLFAFAVLLGMLLKSLGPLGWSNLLWLLVVVLGRTFYLLNTSGGFVA